MNDTVTKILELADDFAAATHNYFADQANVVAWEKMVSARQALQDELVRLFTPLDIQPPNNSGATMCTVRWMAETPNGWVGAYDRAALEQLSIT